MSENIDNSKTTQIIDQNTSAASLSIERPVWEVIEDSLRTLRWSQRERWPYMYFNTWKEVERGNRARRFPAIPTRRLTCHVQWETIRPGKLSIIIWVTHNTNPRACIERFIEKTTKASRVDYFRSYWAAYVLLYNSYDNPEEIKDDIKLVRNHIDCVYIDHMDYFFLTILGH